VENANENGQAKIDNRLDNPARFCATFHPPYFLAMEADKEILAVQSATIL
jgi:hypothetical protein